MEPLMKRIFLVVFFASLFGMMLACGGNAPKNLPKASDLPPGQATDIDGLWEEPNLAKEKGIKFRMEKGRFFAVEGPPDWRDKTTIKDVVQAGPGQYTGSEAIINV